MFHTKNILNRMMSLGLLASMGFVALLSLAQTNAALAATAPPLGNAATFSVLAALSMSAAGAGTVVSGDLGLSPGLASSRTGPWTVGGTEYFGPLSLAGTAQTAALGAYNNLAGQTSDGPWSASPWSPVPGVWTAASDTTFAGTITLSGGYNDVWVFQVGRDMTFSGSVVLTGNAQPCNVFWQIGRSATIASGSTFVGTLIASADVTLVSGATVDGRIISLNSSLTTDGNTISGPICAAAPPTSTPPTLSKAFLPTTINAGGVSTLTFTLSNANATPDTGVNFMDTYPSGVLNATPPNVVNTCGGTVQGGAGGGNTIGLSGVTILGTSSCTISVNVTSALVNSYNNVSGVVNSDQGAGNSASATLSVTAVQPGLTTQASPGITLGGSISDTATLSGGATPTGTITFNLYGPNDATCSSAIFTSTVTVNGNGSYGSTPAFTPTTAGTYRWIANYSGDANNAATANLCNGANENVVVAKRTTALTTQASYGVIRGEAISDTATLSGGATPTGTITFNLYGPNDATCTGAVIFTSTVTVNGSNGTYSSTSFTDTAAGTYRWIANYSGDANNEATANACNAANENVVVERGRPCS